MYIVGLRLCQVLYLEQLQFVLCVASTKSQDATLSAVSSSHKPFDVAEYFLLWFNTGRVIWDQHMFFPYLLLNLKSSDTRFSKETTNSLLLTHWTETQTNHQLETALKCFITKSKIPSTSSHSILNRTTFCNKHTRYRGGFQPREMSTYLFCALFILHSCQTLSTTWLASFLGILPPWWLVLSEINPSETEENFTHFWADWASTEKQHQRKQL